MSAHPETRWVLLDLTPLFNWDSISTADVWPSEPVRFGEVEAFRTRNTQYSRS